MAQKNSIIKSLHNELRNTQNINNNDAVNNNSIAGEEQNNSSDNSETISAPKGDETKVEPPKATKDIKIESADKKRGNNFKANTSLEVKDVAFFVEAVKEWKRPENSGKRNLIHLDETLNSYLGIVKVATGIPAVQFVNYVVTQFLKSNPDFITYVSSKTGMSPFKDDEHE